MSDIDFSKNKESEQEDIEEDEYIPLEKLDKHRKQKIAKEEFEARKEKTKRFFQKAGEKTKEAYDKFKKFRKESAQRKDVRMDSEEKRLERESRIEKLRAKIRVSKNKGIPKRKQYPSVGVGARSFGTPSVFSWDSQKSKPVPSNVLPIFSPPKASSVLPLFKQPKKKKGKGLFSF